MTTVKIERHFHQGPQKDEKVIDEVLVSDGLTGNRLLNAIDKAVEKKFKDDPNWDRWDLVQIGT